MLSARLVCGGANNQLAHPGIEDQLAARGILYAPDYCVNAGGVIQVADELQGFSFARAKAKAGEIFATTARVLATAAEEGIPPGDGRRPPGRAPDGRGCGLAGRPTVRLGERNSPRACNVAPTEDTLIRGRHSLAAPFMYEGVEPWGAAERRRSRPRSLAS